MTLLTLCGAKHDNAVFKALCRSLKRYGDLISLGKDKLIFYHYDTPRDDARKFRIISIFKNSFNEEKHRVSVYQKDAFLTLVASQNKHAVNYLTLKHNIALTCGMSTRDSMTISSLGCSNAIVSTQRTIKTLNSHIIDPGDFRVYLTEKAGLYPIMVTCATLLILGVPHDNEYII